MVSFFQPGHGEDNDNFVYVASSGHVLIVTYLNYHLATMEESSSKELGGLSPVAYLTATFQCRIGYVHKYMPGSEGDILPLG